jgi:hypothetical protein
MWKNRGTADQATQELAVFYTPEGLSQVDARPLGVHPPIPDGGCDQRRRHRVRSNRLRRPRGCFQGPVGSIAHLGLAAEGRALPVAHPGPGQHDAATGKFFPERRGNDLSGAARAARFERINAVEYVLKRCYAL